MYRKFKDYDFREIVGHFVLMKNTNIVKNPDKYCNIDENIEEAKKKIVEDTKNYYKNVFEDYMNDGLERNQYRSTK